VLSSAGAPITAALLDPARLEEDPGRAHRLFAFGALAAGTLTPDHWSALEAGRGQLSRTAVARLAALAPGPLSTLCLTLMTLGGTPSPLDAALGLVAAGAAPRELALPERFCLKWAELVPGLEELLREPSAAAGTRPPEDPALLGPFVERARALGLACARAVRGARLGPEGPEARRRWLEALGPGLPRVLLPRLATLLASEAAQGRLRLDPVRAGSAYEVRLKDGTCLGRGASGVQARVRALGLLAAAEAARPASERDAPFALLAGQDPLWRELGPRLARPHTAPTYLLAVVAGSAARPGPPTDPLNRGVARSLEFDGVLSVRLAPGRRPSGRMLSPEEAVTAVLGLGTGATHLEVLAAQGSARPVAARLSRIAALLRDRSSRRPLAVEAGGRVYLLRGARTHRFELARFAARPRAFTPDPDAPDISVATGSRPGPSSRPAGVVECRAVALDGEKAALLFADEGSGYLREVVSFAEMEDRLREAREIVRMAHPRAVLVVRLADGIDLAARHLVPVGPRVDIAVRGRLPFVEVEIAGERFGGASALSWPAAAEAVLARWPPGGEGRVGVSEVTVAAGEKPASPLLALYASVVARRRLRSYLLRALSSYQFAHAGRQGA
ncbi:MAG TPA: hypothetical protein VMG32_01985, partial [Anaeromyxobacteraceae bacterium]|nr:hypothetical protein [Anaeromyxobacteraceae bacterium]